MDNIVKPIQDAIIGLAYVDDDQVTDVLARKRNLSTNFKVENMTSILAEGFARGNEFLHIVVIDAPDLHHRGFKPPPLGGLFLGRGINPQPKNFAVNCQLSTVNC